MNRRVQRSRSSRGVALGSAVLPAAGLALWLGFGATPQEPGRPVDAGRGPAVLAEHALDEAAAGAALIGELGCVRCHAELEPLSRHHKAAPKLAEIGTRVQPEFLQAFLADPAGVVPGTPMPHLLGSLPASDPEQLAAALTQFLLADAPRERAEPEIPRQEVDAGRALFHRVGCVACHAPREPARPGGALPAPPPDAVPLEHVPAKYTHGGLADFLYDPLAVRPAGRMPDMSLSRGEAQALASYLLDGRTMPAPAPAPDPALVAKGQAAFQALGCASCHDLDGIAPPQPVRLAGPMNSAAGCLADEPQGVPDFRLDARQRAAIGAALAAGPTARTPEQELAVTLSTFRCFACHQRGELGGVRPELDAYFGTDEPALGDQVRIPPALTEVGAKLNPDWLHRVLFDRARVRPYMHTRMPQYGEANLGELPARFAAADPAPPIEIPVFRGQERGAMHDAARELVGANMLACINCHAFNGKPSPAMNGLDLTTTAERLQPAWFRSFLINPQAHRPGIIMPQSWPGSEALRQDVLDGDTGRQIDAIWSYLEQGRTARDPQGIRSEPTVLTVNELPRTYRGRSRVAGFRGIAVGFPQGLNYAFNAETGALAAVWRGSFVRVRWDSQGAGDFDPAARPVRLPQDLAFCQLDTEAQAWPLLPMMTEEQPVNPDPLYPRRLGYRFRGYAVDAGQVPTLKHQLAEVAIDERTEPEGDSTLVRRFQFQTPTAQTLHFRPLAGQIEEVSATEFRVGALRLHIPADTAAQLRPAAAAGEQELVLRLALPAGASTFAIRYELL